MSKFAIKVENLGKEYIIGGAEQRYDSFRSMLSSILVAPFKKIRKLGGKAIDEEFFWALKDISFEVQQGEVLGIIGGNGAGKSTLLKVLSRITTPTEGRAATRGRVVSLLEVGTGFHSELTGRENIYLNGAILGCPGWKLTNASNRSSVLQKLISSWIRRLSGTQAGCLYAWLFRSRPTWMQTF